MRPALALLALTACAAPSRTTMTVDVVTPRGAHSIADASVEAGRLVVPASASSALHGFEARPEGLCAGDVCVPFPLEGGRLDATGFAERVGQPFASSAAGDLWSFGDVPALASPLLAGRAPDFELPDRTGRRVRLSDLRGRKVLLLTWASW